MREASYNDYAVHDQLILSCRDGWEDDDETDGTWQSCHKYLSGTHCGFLGWSVRQHDK